MKDRTLLLVVLCILYPAHSNADSSKYEVGLRANLLLGDGTPANDMIGFGIAGRYYLADGWFIGAALETYEFDFERPVEVVGLEQDRDVDVIDATVNTTVISAALGKKYGADKSGFDWFWSIGIGAGFPDVSSASGPLSTGGTFDLSTTSSTEFHLMGQLGTSYHFSPHWSVNLTARAEHHFIDYEVTERVTGATGTIDSQTPLGFHFGASYRF